MSLQQLADSIPTHLEADTLADLVTQLQRNPLSLHEFHSLPYDSFMRLYHLMAKKHEWVSQDRQAALERHRKTIEHNKYLKESLEGLERVQVREGEKLKRLRQMASKSQENKQLNL